MSTNLLFVLLQDVSASMDSQLVEESYFSILLKGGWILLPLFLLLFLAVFIIIERVLVIKKSKNDDMQWLPRTKELIQENKVEKAIVFCSQIKNSSSTVIAVGLDEFENGVEEVQEAMLVESRQEISRLEQGMNYLGITATIAPMLGFLGTIFGVIKIFYNIAVTSNLNIANLSDGLYQKMICSGVGLFVGIIAYAGYYILNGKIDEVVLQIEKDTNDILKTIRQLGKKS